MLPLLCGILSWIYTYTNLRRNTTKTNKLDNMGKAEVLRDSPEDVVIGEFPLDEVVGGVVDGGLGTAE